MELTPALHEHKSEAGLLLLLNDHAPPTPATTAAPTPAAAGAAAATGGAAASGATRAGQLASFRFQTSIALPTAQPSPPLSRKPQPQPQPQEQRQEPEGQDGESVSSAAGGGEGRPRGGTRRRGLMGRLNSSGDGFSYPRRQAGKRKRGAAPAGSSGSSSTASASGGSTSSPQDGEAAEPRPRPFLQSLLLSRSTSVDSLGSMRTPTPPHLDSAMSLTLRRASCVVSCGHACRVGAGAAVQGEGREDAAGHLLQVEDLPREDHPPIGQGLLVVFVVGIVRGRLAPGPARQAGGQLPPGRRRRRRRPPPVPAAAPSPVPLSLTPWFYSSFLIIISLINICRARGRERALRLVCSMLDSPPGEGEPSEHREMALHHLYRALWCHPAAPAPAASVVVVHHRNVLVRTRRSHPTPHSWRWC